MLSSWNRGIEAWRFDLPTHWERGARVRAHAVLDRTLLRAGETLSIKAYARSETVRGLALLPADRLPPRAVLTHVGSGQEFGVPLAWTGARYATASFAIPREARLGAYEIALEMPARRVARAAGPEPASAPRVPSNGAASRSGVEADPEEEADSGPTRLPAGRFRVEEFRLPTMTGRVAPAADASLVAPRELPVAVQLDYLSGGPAAGLPMRVSALARERALTFEGWDGFSFEPLRLGAGNEELPPSQRLVADRRALTLDAQGTGALLLKDLPPVTRATDLVIEASYADPSGELQTLSHTAVLWPAALAVGIRTGGWVSVSKGASAQVVVLDPRGRPLAGREVEVNAAARRTLSHRKRLVGGFYAYDHREERRPLGTVCSGRTDANGLLACEIALKEPGNVELVATARDDAGRAATAAASLWVTGRGELWFDGENHDRIDLIPEKRRYQPGETAKLQVRMPFRQATALVAVEREGVIDTQVVRLSGRDPTVSVPIRAGYGPNVYVSVLAVRERMRDVPWYSLFQWGWRDPVDWWRERRAWRAPDAMVDLTRPAYRLGIAELRVGLVSNELQVQVQPDRAEYPVRGRAQVTVSVRTPDGRPLPAGTPVAFAAVDQALLELSPNASWSVPDAMMARRPYGMETYTAQMHVVGRRHFGRKAVAPGGGGGRGATRELFDTLLLWQPAVPLGADGSARIEVPLNDSLTSFALVAVADADTALFGTGRASIRTTQPLQLVSGLPPLVRDGDRYRAAVTVRNASAREMSIEVSARAAGYGELAPQRVKLTPNAAQEVAWTVTVPASEAVDWELAARELDGAAADRLRVRQRIAAAVPAQVQQATMLQLDRPRTIAFAAPAAALPDSARLDVDLQASLAAPMPGVRRWFERYPYQCLEQRASRAIGLRDEAAWSALVRQLPAYLDRDGLAAYFPVSDGGAQGSDVLTAYLLAASHEAGYAIPDEALARMQAGLAAWLDGRIERASRAPSPDLVPRKLAAIEALARRGRAQPRMLESVRVDPAGWPTHAVIDWVSVLRRIGDVPDRGKRLDEAYAVLRGRLDLSGTRLVFSTERSDDWWWTMASPDANASRLLLAVLDDAGWRDDLPRLLAGTLQRQSGGAWRTTTANLWGSLAVERFARRLEAGAVSGSTRVALGAVGREHVWRGPGGAHLELPLPAVAAPATLSLSHQGSGAPWATVASLAAVPLASAAASGLRVAKTVAPVDAKTPGAPSRGDTLRVRLTIDAQSDVGWVVVSDPLPAGAVVLGSGLGRDSRIGTGGEQIGGVAWPAYVERSHEAFRAYYEYLPKGSVQLEYTVRLNASGTFRLPPTRAEAMYAPEVFGALPNAALVVR